ncbi:hypothetical protein EYF80_028923 [Liparis tanakae]|uniref:Uncharacterized protein n=1 Tax=Liparis tanakae TaxID=230148 RepID=A0A4Z2H4Y9_9TELE|nr:hypothetical protein EYF80_028923 [Liparis tanakae]
MLTNFPVSLERSRVTGTGRSSVSSCTARRRRGGQSNRERKGGARRRGERDLQAAVGGPEAEDPPPLPDPLDPSRTDLV